MPSPTASELEEIFFKEFAGSLGEEGKKYVTEVAEAVADGWETWQKGLKFGGLTVNGAGLGAWSGTGSGGSMTENSPFELPDMDSEKKSEEQEIFVQAFREVLEEVFTKWVDSFSFSSVAFVGTSTASALSPGIADAVVTPSVPLSSAGSGSNPASISDDWASKLTKPKFDIDNPQAKTKDMTDAAGAMIEKGFEDVWLLNALASANSFQAPAAAGAGTATGSSKNDGKIV